MSDPLTPDDPQVTTQPLQLIQTAYEQLGADTCLPNVYHAVVCTQKSLQYEWRRILQGADEVCTGTDTWPSGEPIQYCYFLPGGRTDAFQKSPLDQAKMEAANKVVTRVGELGEKALALVNALGIVKGNVTGLFPRENWLYLLYSFSWKYPGLGLSAERYRIFRPSKDSPFTTDPTYRKVAYDVRVSVEDPSSMEHETPSMTWKHDGKIWTESIPEAFSHSYFAALTPDICAASARVIAAMLRPAACEPGGPGSGPNATADADAIREAIEKAGADITTQVRAAVAPLVKANGEADPEVKVAICAGGFEYADAVHPLTGRPLAMLKAILQSRFHRCTREELRIALAVDDEAVNYPEQVIIDTAKQLRAALRKAITDAGRQCDNPFPSTGRRADLTYALEVP